MVNKRPGLVEEVVEEAEEAEAGRTRASCLKEAP